MKAKNIKELQDEVSKMISDRSAEIDSLENAIAAEEVAIKKASAEMDAASEKSDLKAYQKAKSEKVDAADSMEMHQKRLDRLQSEPLISSEEYADMKALIVNEMDNKVEQAKPELKTASEQLAAIGTGISEQAKEANDLLQRIQSGLYLNKDRRRGNNGFFTDSAISYRGHAGVCSWANVAINSNSYKDYTKEER